MDSAAAHHARGVALLQAGRPADAVAALARAVELAPHIAQYLSNLAEAHRRAGAAQRGTECARRAVALDRDYRMGWTNLGCCCYDSGDHAGALDAFEQASALAPGDASLHAFCADALRELGRVRAAIVCYERAIALDPALAHAHTNLGPLLLAVGRDEESIACCRRAAELAPGTVEPLINLGRCLVGVERLDEAMDVYAAAQEIAPDSALLAHNIGLVWEECGDAVQASLWFDQALALEPQRLETRIQRAALEIEHGVVAKALADLQAIVAEHPGAIEAHAALARAWWEDGDAAEAVSCCRCAVAVGPELASLHSQMGQVLASAGNVAAAIDAYRSALEVNPNSIGALFGLATSLGGRVDPAHVAHLHALLGNDRVRDGGRAKLHNALAHVSDGSGDYAAAARHAAEANALQWRYQSQRGWRYDAAQYSARIDALMRTFSAEFFERSRAWGLDDEAPVFVIGMPRSGTTLTEQILASHPRVLGVGERPFAIRGFEAHVDTTANGAWLMPNADGVIAAAQWHRGELAGLVRKSGREPERVLRIVDKMPDNFSVLGWLATLFPRARFIHCRRDMRDVAVSCWITQFAQIEWACSFESIAARVRDYRRVMDHWRRVLPVPMLEIDYEGLVANQETESRRLVDLLGLEWDTNCLAFHRSDRLVRTASVTQVRQPIYTRSVARWRRYAAPLAPLFEMLES